MNQTTCNAGMVGCGDGLVRKAVRLAAVAGLTVVMAVPVAAASGQVAAAPGGGGGGMRGPDVEKPSELVFERAAGRLKLHRQGEAFTLEVGSDVTFGDLVEAVSRLSLPKPANIVLDPELESRRGDIVPPITLRNVDATSILDTLIWHISNAWTGLPNRLQASYSGGQPLPGASPGSRLISTIVIRLSLAVPTAGGNTAAGESAATVEFFAISDLLDGMKRAGDAKPTESLQTSLDIGLRSLREKGNQPEITVHAETGLLIVRATPRQMAVIRSAINAVQARTQSVLRKVWAEEKMLHEMKAIDSQLNQSEEEAARNLKEAEKLESSGAAGNRNPARLAAEEAQRRARMLRDRAATLQLEATGRPALLDAPPIGGPRWLESDARETEAIAKVKADAAAASDPVAAQITGKLREQQAKIAEAERALEVARRQLEDLTRKLRDEQAAAAKAAADGK